MTLKESFNFYFFGILILGVFAVENFVEKLRSLKFAPLPCNGILCAWHLRYTHLTCCYCRSRRRALRQMTLPPYWIEYVYKASVKQKTVTTYIHGRVRDNGVWKGGVKASSHKPFIVQTFSTLHIDPRGHFTSVRCAAIIVIDKIMLRLNLFREGMDGRPLSEICEFLANYP